MDNTPATGRASQLLLRKDQPSKIFLPNPIQDAAHKADSPGERHQYWTTWDSWHVLMYIPTKGTN